MLVIIIIICITIIVIQLNFIICSISDEETAWLFATSSETVQLMTTLLY